MLIVVFLLSILRPALAQQQNIRPINPVLLQKLADEQALKHQANKLKIRELARKHPWLISETPVEGQHISLQGISDSGKPLFYTVFNNAHSGITTNTSRVWTGGTTGLKLNGASPLLSGKLGIWDGGAVLPSHQELNGRIVNRDGATSISDHATHVAGTLIAAGINAAAKGMAYQALDLQSWDFGDDHSEIAAAANNLLLSNHSYGYATGWVMSGTNWIWLGNSQVSLQEDVYFGYYDASARLWDEIAFHAPYYLMVKAVGNSRNMPEPAIGTPFYWLDQATGNWEYNTRGRTAEMRHYKGYDVIPDHSVAKNILSVGAISPLPEGYTQPSDVVAYLASSFGPTDDGRIKPDLVGSGIRVLSPIASANDAYQQATGTSTAAPNITGSLFLLQEHYANLNEGHFMRAATLKGLAIHSAQEAGPFPGPDYMFGWGVMDTDEAARVLSPSGGKDLVSERELKQNGTYTYPITAAGTEPIKVTISWTDPQGTVLPLEDSTALNNRTPMLVNDLDIRLTSGGNTFQPWVLDPDNPAAPATTGDNSRDNVEQVFIANPIPGAAYTLSVSHKNSLVNGAQHFALLISGMAGTPYCSSAPTETANSRIEKMVLGTMQHHSPTGHGTYSDYTARSTHVEAGKTMPLSVSITNVGPTQAEKIAKVFIDWNEDGNFEDTGENVLTTEALTGPATLSGNITIPEFVRIGHGTRMRIVLVETNDAALVKACGPYAKGETADFTVKFVRQARDVGISALTIPTATSLWANPAQSLTVRIKNFDAIAQSNIPVTVTIKNGAAQVATLSGTFTGNLDPLQEALFTLPGAFPVTAAATYELVATTALTGDQDSANDNFKTVITSSPLGAPPAISATLCMESPLVTLKGSGTGSVVWFDAATGGKRLSLGSDTSTAFKPADKIYYAALKEYAGTTLTLNNPAAGTYSGQENDTIYFQAFTALILDRVTINTGAGGQATVKLMRLDGTLLDSVQLALVPGLAEYGLNFAVPAAVTPYGLLISKFQNGATANHHEGTGTIGYPYNTPSLLKITRSVSGSAYLYNWKFRPAGSPSARVGVKANGGLTTSRSVVCAGANAGTLTFAQFHGTIIRWEKSTGDSTWTPIPHTASKFTFRDLTDTTRFRVIIREAGCAAACSDPITIIVKPSGKATVLAPEGTVLCPGAGLPLVAGIAKKYVWSNGDTTQQIQVFRAGTYTVQVSNEAGCSDSVSLTVTAPPVAWTGRVDSDWFNAANWNCQVPDSTTDVHIPAGLPHYPTIGPGSATCKNLVIQGTLSISGGNLTINGHFTNYGPRPVSFDNPLPGLQMFPNPSYGRLELQAHAEAAGPLILEIKNTSGQTVYATRKHLNKGENAIHLDLRTTLKPGLYLVLGRYENRLYPLKLVVE